MKEVIILLAPKVGDRNGPGQDRRNDEGFIDFIYYVGQKLIFLRIGHAVLDKPLSGA